MLGGSFRIPLVLEIRLDESDFEHRLTIIRIGASNEKYGEKPDKEHEGHVEVRTHAVQGALLHALAAHQQMVHVRGNGEIEEDDEEGDGPSPCPWSDLKDSWSLPLAR